MPPLTYWAMDTIVVTTNLISFRFAGIKTDREYGSVSLGVSCSPNYWSDFVSGSRRSNGAPIGRDYAPECNSNAAPTFRSPPRIVPKLAPLHKIALSEAMYSGITIVPLITWAAAFTCAP
jgi:hypothetical protein